ncbi:MAG: phosphate signaling complex protein PhoU, partial [Bdellovibrionales bacterium]|nr:phosphate signaling complex protein PhoU [Bdellovibrionales bacterium]
MDRHFETELKGLKHLILEMGSFVEKAIELACQGIAERENQRFSLINNYEEKINRAHKEVDRQCLQLLARQALVASDLRLVLVVTKINTDLERMGDQACNILYNGQDYLAHPPIPIKTDIINMATQVRAMVRDALDAFVRLDVGLSRQVLTRDDVIDNAKDQVFAEVKEYIKTHPFEIDACLDLI